MKIYVPNVYQESVYDIDYDKLKQAGVRCISFDISDTLTWKFGMVPSDPIVNLFRWLKRYGFKVVLLSNSWEDRVSRFANILECPYISGAQKPGSRGFRLILEKYDLEPFELAHVGNSIVNDVSGGNMVGVITCMVKRKGLKIPNLFKKNNGIKDALWRKRLWRKNHLFTKGDQYYQLGETPIYRMKG